MKTVSLTLNRRDSVARELQSEMLSYEVRLI